MLSRSITLPGPWEIIIDIEEVGKCCLLREAESKFFFDGLNLKYQRHGKCEV